MDYKTIIIIIVVIVLLYIVIRYIITDANTLTGLMAGTTMQTVPATSLASSSVGGNSNFAVSIWFYVNDWSYQYGSLKPLLSIGEDLVVNFDSSQNNIIITLKTSPSGSITSNISAAAAPFGFCPNGAPLTSITDDCKSEGTIGTTNIPAAPYGYVAFGQTESARTGLGDSGPNNVAALMNTYGYCANGSNSIQTGITGCGPLYGYSDSTNTTYKLSNSSILTTSSTTMTVNNFPIQKWVNFTISVYGKSLDVYIDGKLTSTKLLNGIASVNPSNSVSIASSGGFAGWTSKFSYYPNALNPQDVWNIYQAGYGASWFSNLFGKYNVKVSVLDNGMENSSLTF